jgi:hypothetical protein
MKKAAFISELHDIGKLVDVQVIKEAGIKFKGSQTFQNFDFSQLNIAKPSSPSWFSQYSNEKISLTSTKIPQHYLTDVLLTKLADEISSTISRTRRGSKDFEQRKEKGEFTANGLHVLWNPSFYEDEEKSGYHWAAFRTPEELKRMFKFIDECTNPTEFFEKFKENLSLTAEDKAVPFNVIDLFTHLELTGKIYRVLRNHSKSVIENNKVFLEYTRKRISTKQEASGGRLDEPMQRGKWIFRLLFCHVNFPQTLSRLQDLNIFKLRTEQIKAFSENDKTRDYVLFFTDDYMCLFIPKTDELSICELLQPFTDKGLIIDYTEMEAELSLLTSSYEKAYSEFHALPQTNRYLKIFEKQLNAQLQPEIGPNICDSCQIREGKERIKEQVRECLCDTCYEIRDMGKPAGEYAKWEGKAAWLKITLDQDRLRKMLLELFEEYVDNSPLMNNVISADKTELKNSFRPLAVQMDFVKDYKTLLNDFKEKIYTIKDETENPNPTFTRETFLYPIDGYNEFGIFKATTGKSLLAVINTFTDCIEQIFPKCLTSNNFPIRLAISIAPVKYPYQEHWHFLSEPKGTIDIQSPSERLTLNTQQYRGLNEKIGKANVALSHFLHRLIGIKTTTKSGKMVMLEVYERNNRNKFSALLELLEDGLTPEQILAFYNLVQDEQA